MKLTLPYPPSVNHLYSTVNGRRVKSAEGRAFKEECGWTAKAQGVRMLKGDVRVTVHFFRPRKTGDLDNSAKALFDSMTGIAWEDDKQVAEIHAYRNDTDPKNPRAELEIEEI